MEVQLKVLGYFRRVEVINAQNRADEQPADRRSYGGWEDGEVRLILSAAQ